MIGFYDPYLFESPDGKLNPPNVEIMKLATYYREKNMHNRLILPGESVDAYEKIYCFSEKPCNIPNILKSAPNVIYGGTYFTNGKYIPFNDSMIDYTIPKIGVYYQFLKQCKVNPKLINDFLDNAYYRIGNEKLIYPAPVIHKQHRLYIYDKNPLEREDWQKNLQKFSSHGPSAIYFIHPIYCTSLNVFFQLREINKISRENEIILNLLIPSNEVSLMFKKYLNLMLADITLSSKTYLQLGGDFPTITQYYQNLIYTLNLLFCFWAKGVPIKIRYKEPSLGKINPIENLSRMIESWADISSPAKRNLVLQNQFYTSQPDPRKNEYEKLLNNFPSVKNLFNQSYEGLKIRKYWGF